MALWVQVLEGQDDSNFPILVQMVGDNLKSFCSQKRTDGSEDVLHHLLGFRLRLRLQNNHFDLRGIRHILRCHCYEGKSMMYIANFHSYVPLRRSILVRLRKSTNEMH